MRLARLVVAVAAAVLLSACGSLWHTNDSGYISGDGRVLQYPADQRTDPVALTGTLLDGGDLDLASLRGKVVVVNTWGAWCAECIIEAPLLNDAYDRLTGALGDGVAFVGIDIRDPDPAQALAFERANEVAWPSVYSRGGEELLAFDNELSPRTIPSTAVLDRQGRVAAIIRGTIPSALTLVDVVTEIAGEAVGDE